MHVMDLQYLLVCCTNPASFIYVSNGCTYTCLLVVVERQPQIKVF